MIPTLQIWISEPGGLPKRQNYALDTAAASCHSWQWLRMWKTKQNRIPGPDSWDAYERKGFSELRCLHLLIHRRMLNSLRYLLLHAFSCVYLRPASLWDSPGKITGVGCHLLLQEIFPIQGSNLCLLSLLHGQVGSLPPAPPGKPPWDAWFSLTDNKLWCSDFLPFFVKDFFWLLLTLSPTSSEPCLRANWDSVSRTRRLKNFPPDKTLSAFRLWHFLPKNIWSAFYVSDIWWLSIRIFGET